LLGVSGLELCKASPEDFVGRSLGDHWNQQSEILVKRNQRGSAPLIHLKPHRDRFGPVIFSLN
jgi:hypothetical protein